MKININKIPNIFPILEHIVFYTAHSVEHNMPVSQNMGRRRAMCKLLTKNWTSFEMLYKYNILLSIVKFAFCVTKIYIKLPG